MKQQAQPNESGVNPLSVRLKYVSDRFLAFWAIIFVSPILLLIAVAIKLDDGGCVFLKQERLGLDGKLFRMFKFRSMVENADGLLGADGSVDGRVNRITPVGRILRRSSLDELPQLFNILVGEMSLIGPRPALPSHWFRYTEDQKRRVRMRPGITGWAQVHGRNRLPWSMRIVYDNEYIDRYSWILDLKIVWMTVCQICVGKDMILDRNPREVDDLASPKESD